MPEENVSGHMQTGGKLMWQNKGTKLELPQKSDQELPERLDGHAILVKILKRNACIYFDLLGNILLATSESPIIEF